MLAANCIDISEIPDFDESTGLLPKEDDDGNFLFFTLFLHLLITRKLAVL